MNKSLQGNLSRAMGYAARRVVIGAAGSLMLCLASVQAGNVLTVNITGTVIAGPACQITGNANNRIEVDFGNNLQTTSIDGSNYAMPIPLALTCSGNPSSLRLRFLSPGGGSTFDGNVLATNISDLGIKLLQPDNSALNLGDWFTFAYSATPPAIKAVPVKRTGATLPGGMFGASATLEMEVL
ncbi:fimbrial protein [Serratia fonticola]|uniref:fimbrial protein n=1 Tax=Serratia fonticola TaxID=47917 RepID=UPI003BB79F64